ncbi:hypothetical protein [Actinoplanes sp. NPDC049599]|uniref:hypothetical protein n=1 Tax=Actinoplanes sp. NPDC049599 TaxID=3363903 RepID=UPI00378AE0CD
MINNLVARAATDDWDAVEQLEQLAKADPAILRPHHRELLERGLLWPSVLFAGADEELVEQIITRIDSGDQRLGHLLLILAEVRGEPAAAAFRRWQEAPPPGMDRLHIDALAYAREGGWDLRPDGTNHLLYGLIAYELHMKEPNSTHGNSGGAHDSVSAGGNDAGGHTAGNGNRPADTAGRDTGEGTLCPWCESPIWTVMDLDTANPEVARALAHTGWAGRLRVTTCFLCTNYTTLFTAVTHDGGSSWSACNERPDYLRTTAEEPPRVRPEVGPARATRWLASAWKEGGSTLGGVPDWIQDAAYPECPVCAKTMDYVGLVGGADLGWGEGADYIFVHSGCGIAAVAYQQS